MSTIGFTCNEAPLQLTNTSDLSGVTVQANAYGNAGARLWSIAQGTRIISTPTDRSAGIIVNENIQTSFTFNSVNYNLIDMRIFYGQHKLFKWNDVTSQSGMQQINNSNLTTNDLNTGIYTCPFLEIYIFFKNNLNQIICLVLPIGIDNSKNSYASAYINSLTTSTDGSQTKATLSTLFQDLSGATGPVFNANNMILQYIGQDIRTYIAYQCDSNSINNPVTYLLIMNDIGDLTGNNKSATNLYSSTIKYNEYINLYNKLSTFPANLPSSVLPIDASSGNLSKLKFIPGGTLYVTNTNTGSYQNYVNTSAVKCYPVNPTKNIKNGQLYLDETKQPISLEDATTTATSIGEPSIPISSPNYWSSSAGVETIIAICIATILTCGVGYFISAWIYNKNISLLRSAGKIMSTARTSVGTSVLSAASSITQTTQTTRLIIAAIIGIIILTWAIVMTILYAVK
jgi:hypothetical protein